MMPFVSIVIPTFNRRAMLERVLPTLTEQTYPRERYEILVCDDGSTDNTSQIVHDLSIPNLRYLPDINRGRSAARNRGIREAVGEIVLFCDSDTPADKRLIEEHVLAHQSRDNVAIVGNVVEVESFDVYYRALDHPGEARSKWGNSAKEISWLFFITGNASVRREALLKVGMFDEDFVGYGNEDLELGYRLAKNGVRIFFCPGATNYHIDPWSIEERCEKERQSGVSIVHFYRKYRDRSILLLTGVNPVWLFLHRFVSADGWVLKYCQKRADDPGVCRDIVLQFHFLTGVKNALHAP